MTLEEELKDCKAELNITDYALTLACEHTNNLDKDHFIRVAKTLLEVRRLTENDT